MSSSQEKKNRREISPEASEKKRLARLKEDKKRKNTRRNYIIAGVLIVLFTVFTIVMNSNIFYTGVSAVKSGDEDYKAADYEYVYITGFNNFYKRNNSYLSWLMDTTKPLDDQDCAMMPEGTWADYFESSALQNLQTMAAQYSAAKSAGYTLSEEDQANIDDYIAMYQSDAEKYGYTLDKFLAANFGRGVDEATVRSMMEKGLVAAAYAEDQYNSYSYTDDELETYYQENAEKYDLIKFLYVYVDGAAEETDLDGDGNLDEITEEQTAEAMKAALEIAEEIEKAENRESFETLAADLAEEATELSRPITDVASAYSEWLGEAGRVEGDTHVAESGEGYYVIYYLGQDDNRYNTANVRHILIKVEDTDEDSELSDEERDAAREKLEAIYDEWKNGEATEESFAELVNQYSEDEGSNTTGGLYEKIARGKMVAPFEEFCFAGHEPGDTGIVYSESTNYTGYHLIYYVGDGPLYSHVLADSTLRTEDFTAWSEELVAPFEPKTSSVPLWFANKEMSSLTYRMISK